MFQTGQGVQGRRVGFGVLNFEVLGLGVCILGWRGTTMSHYESVCVCACLVGKRAEWDNCMADGLHVFALWHQPFMNYKKNAMQDQLLVPLPSWITFGVVTFHGDADVDPWGFSHGITSHEIVNSTWTIDRSTMNPRIIFQRTTAVSLASNELWMCSHIFVGEITTIFTSEKLSPLDIDISYIYHKPQKITMLVRDKNMSIRFD